MAGLTLDRSWRERSTLTGVQLADGSASGGFLIERDEGPLLVLFAEEDVRVGDRVRVARDLVLTVAGVKRGSLTGERVTALEVRPARKEV